MSYVYKKIRCEDLSEEEFEQIMDVENSTGNGYDKEEMQEILQQERFDSFVCYSNDVIVGVISCNPNSKRRNGSIYMINLTVINSKEHRNKGIATALISEAVKYYRDKGLLLDMSLQVDKDNIPALNLYKKVGFEIREPICEADIDDEQYIMDSTLNHLIQTIESIKRKK